jgi:hypothetical protein
MTDQITRYNHKECVKCGNPERDSYGITLKVGGIYQQNDKWSDLAVVSLCSECLGPLEEVLKGTIRDWLPDGLEDKP